MNSLELQEIREQLLALSAPSEPTDPRGKKRLRILRAATVLFVRQGYRKTSVDEVAQRAGIAKGTVYLYFKTKPDLLMEALQEEQKRYLAKLLPVFEEGISPRERMKSYLRMMLSLSGEMPLVARLRKGDQEILTALEDMDTSLRDRRLEMGITFLSCMIDEVAAPHSWTQDELKERARVLTSLLLTDLGAERMFSKGLSRERYAELLADMLVDGLGNARADASDADSPR